MVKSWGKPKDRTKKSVRCFYGKNEGHYMRDYLVLKRKSKDGECSSNSDINLVFKGYQCSNVLAISFERLENE